MLDPAKLKIKHFDYIVCPETDQIVTVEQCENCDSSGEIDDDTVECHYGLDKP